MTDQKHIIKKQTFEIHLSNDKPIQAIQEEIGNLQRERLASVINELCDQYSPSGSTHKIDTLHIDLGAVSLENFEEVFAEKFQEALIQSDAKVIQSKPATQTPDNVNEVEMLAYYLRTGNLPWWSAEHKREPIEQLLNDLTTSPSPLFLKVLGQVFQEEVYLKRFVFTFSDDQIIEAWQCTTRINLSEVSHFLKSLTSFVQENALAFPKMPSPAEIRNTWWMAIGYHLKKSVEKNNLTQKTALLVLKKLRVNPIVLQETVSDAPSSPIAQLLAEHGTPTEIPEIARIESLLQQLLKRHTDNPTMVSFIRIVERLMGRSSFAEIPTQQVKTIFQGLKQLEVPTLSTPTSKVVSNETTPQDEESLNWISRLLERLIQGEKNGSFKPEQIKSSKKEKQQEKQSAQSENDKYLEAILLEKISSFTKDIPGRVSPPVSIIITQLKSLLEEHKKQPSALQSSTRFVRYLERFIEILQQIQDTDIENGQGLWHEVMAHIQELKSTLQTNRTKSNRQWLKTITQEKLTPLSKHIHQIQRQLEQSRNMTENKVIEQLYSEFDDTESISVPNAGIVILWPFLMRLFENLELVDQKEFVNTRAQIKAASVLQFLTDDALEEAFEGLFALNKVICGIDLMEPIEVIVLDEDEKEIAEGLLQAVLNRGPLWQNLSMTGLRKSYLQREGLLSTRDGLWLLRVKKETYDITLGKLPWQFSTIKLPWMNEMLMIEWL